MKTAYTNIPVEAVIPCEYDIRIQFVDDNTAKLIYTETFGDDISIEIVDRTMTVLTALFKESKNTEIIRDADREITVISEKSPLTILNSVIRELELARQAYTPVPNMTTSNFDVPLNLKLDV